MSMESRCSGRSLSALSDEAECYLHAKRIKIESNQKTIEKEKQQKLKQSIHCVKRYQTLPHEPKYLPERQNSWSLDMQSCDPASKTCVREFFCFQACSSEILPCRVSENKLATKNWSPENEKQITVEDGISLNAHEWPRETELHNVWNANTSKNLHVLNTPQVQQNNNIEHDNKINSDNELKQNSSVTSLNRDLFQMELLSHNSVSNKKWKQYQIPLQIPFLCGTSSVFSHTEHEKNNIRKKVYTTEGTDNSSNDNETIAERGNKEKNNSSYIIPTLKPFRSVQPLEIPIFKFPRISNKINVKMESANLKDMDQKNFKGQLSLMQSKQIYDVIEQMQNDKSIQPSTVDSEFREKNYTSISKQEYSAFADGRKVPVTYFRDQSTDIDCNQIFAKSDFKDKTLENSDGDDDQESRIHIYISTKNIQKEKCFSYNGLLKKMGRKNSNENTGTFHIQTSFLVITKALEKNKLVIHCSTRNSNSNISVNEAESKLSTKEILYFKRYLTKNIIFERNCPHIIVQNFSDKIMTCNIFRGQEMLKLKFSFQDILFEWTESSCKDMAMIQEDSITHRFHLCEALSQQCDTQEVVKNNTDRSPNKKICVSLLAVISKHLKVELLRTILASFFSNRNPFLSTEGEYAQVMIDSLCDRKQVQLNSGINCIWRQNTEFHKKGEIYPGTVNSKFVESIGFECQRRRFSSYLDSEESSFLKSGTLFHNQQSGLCKGRRIRKHHLISRGIEGFLRLVSHKNGMKKQVLVAKCLILLQGTFDCSSLDKSNVTKIQPLTGTNLRFWSYIPAHAQLEFEKVDSRCTNQELPVATVKQEKKKPSKICDSSFHGERCKSFPFGLCENKIQETAGCRKRMKSTNEATYVVKNYLGTSSYINADTKEHTKSKVLQINSHSFLSKTSVSIFDTYEKIPLTSDSEDFDQIPVVNQGNSVKEKLFEEYSVTSSKKVHNSPAKSNDVLILPEQSKTSMEKCNSFLVLDSQTSKHEHCKKIDEWSPYLANKVQNTHLNFENMSSGSSILYQSVTLPLDSSILVNKDGVASEDGHSRSFSSADKQTQNGKNHATLQYTSRGSPTMTDTYLQLQARETAQPFSQGHTQTNKAVGLEPATLKQHLEYVKEQEEISDEQMHVTNESQCEIVMNDLIMSYSEDESKTFIAAEEKLKMHLSVMNNGCLEDVKNKYLPLENKITYEFELKRKFDLVLEELHMFHEISRGNENNLSSVETKSHNNYCELNNSEGIDENVTSVPQKKICISSPICGTTEGQNITDSNENSLNEKMSNENEDQNVFKEYSTSRLSSEELLYSPVSEGYLDAAYKKPYTWDPAFLSCTVLKEPSYNLQKEGGYFLSHEVIRVQPLKTCKGPIRIGLSRRARPKQLHPYLK